MTLYLIYEKIKDANKWREVMIDWEDENNQVNEDSDIFCSLSLNSAEFREIIREKLGWERKNRQGVAIRINIEESTAGINPGDESAFVSLYYDKSIGSWVFYMYHTITTNEKTIVKDKRFHGIEVKNKMRSFRIVIKEESVTLFFETIKNLIFNPGSYDFDELREFTLKHAERILEDRSA